MRLFNCLQQEPLPSLGALLTLACVACDGGNDTAACAAMSSGEDWAWSGECPQMSTPCEIIVSGCDLTIAYSSGMTMGMPYGGVIEDDSITFFDDNNLEGCVGTLSDADNASGACGDGCTFALTRE